MDDAQMLRLVELLRAEIRSEVQTVVRAEVERVVRTEVERVVRTEVERVVRVEVERVVRSEFSRLESKLDRYIEFAQQQFHELGERLDRVEQRLDRLEEGHKSLRAEMLERFESVHDRLRELERRSDHVVAAVDGLRREVELLSKQTHELTVRMNGLGEDMNQRFRVVNERLSELAA